MLAKKLISQIKPVRPTGKYPAKNHCRKVVSILKQARSDAGHTDGISVHGYIFLEGQKAQLHENCDQEVDFRQRRSFYYLSGCNLPDCALLYDIASDWLTLVVPAVDEEKVMWAGMPLLPAEAVEKYNIDECISSDELPVRLSQTAQTANQSGDARVYTLDTTGADLSEFARVCQKFLLSAVDEARVVKDSLELDLIRYANAVSSIGHIDLMGHAKNAESEASLHAVFQKNCIERFCRRQAYDCIVACGPSAATLHYTSNEASLDGKLNVLVDAGGEYECYAADISRTIPIHGRGFSPESRLVYEAVERMQDAAFGVIRAGVRWEDAHIAAHRVAIEALRDWGVLRPEFSVEELLEARVSAGFFPHGLGHYLGLDTHDTGGKANYEDEDVLMRYLRIRGPVPAGAVVTVEPGIYFSPHLLGPFLEGEKGQYVDKDALARFWQVGGVRIEDDVVVTETGYENLTLVPRSVAEIETLVREGH